MAVQPGSFTEFYTTRLIHEQNCSPNIGADQMRGVHVHEQNCSENIGADQLHGKHVADQQLCFRYIDSTIPLLPKSLISSL